MVYIRNQSRHLLAMVEVPGLRDLEQRMNEAFKKNMMNNLVISDIMSIFASSKRRRSQNLFYVRRNS